MSGLFSNFRKNLIQNLGTIIKATVFSIFIWFFISIQIFPDITLHVEDIDVICEPTVFMAEENLRIISVDTKKVTVQIEGKRYDISDIKPENFTAVCDLSSVHESGEYNVDVVVTPAPDIKCRVLSVKTTAKVKVIKMISKDFAVVPNTSNLSISDQMQIEGEVLITPPVVTITGEEKLINSIGKVEAVAEYGEALDRSSDVPAVITLYNNNFMKMLNPDVIFSDYSFTASVPVYKTKTMPVNVKFTNNVSSSTFNISDLDYTMSINDITIASPDSSIDNLDALDVGEIMLSSLTLKDLQGGVALPVKLPDGYRNISGNKTITVAFPGADEYGQLGFTIPAENISIINAPSNFDIKVLTNELLVNVVGFSNYIQEMTSDDIFATVNLLGVEISEGTKSVSASFRLSGANVKAWVTGEEYKVDLLIVSNEESTAE